MSQIFFPSPGASPTRRAVRGCLTAVLATATAASLTAVLADRPASAPEVPGRQPPVASEIQDVV